MSTAFRPSVIIPAYNAEAFLSEALESVLGQTVPAHEVIVIDDGSTDRTVDVARRFGSRITCIQQVNGGVSAARNAGLNRASGNWLAFLDADDIWLPEKLERVAPACLQKNGPGVVFSDYFTFGAEERLHRPSQLLPTWNPSRDVLVPLISVMPSAALVPNGHSIRFPEWARNDEDAIFFNMMARTGPVVAVAEPLMRYRKHPSQAQAQVGAAPIGSMNLLRWATEQEASVPGTTERLFHSLATLVVSARWKRDWTQYWTLRKFCHDHWPDHLDRPDVLGERLWPPFVYAVKDVLDGLTRR